MTDEMIDTDWIATYCKRSPKYARDKVVCQPDFPKPVELIPGAQPLWWRSEFELWAKGRKRAA